VKRTPSLRTRIPSFFDSSVFEAAQPGDTIYALLAISRETTPKNLLNDPDTKELTKEEKFALKLAPKEGFANKAYKVDYRLSGIDVYQESIEFSIRKAEKKRALDILCRAWALTVMKSHDDPFLKPARDKKHEKEKGKSHLKEEHKKLETRKGEEVEEKDREIP
jgi:hypothetical protein